MNINDIKIGATYNVRVKVTGIENMNRIITHVSHLTEDDVTVFYANELPSFHPIPSEQQASACTQPQPLRLYREGDIVTPCQANNRWLSDLWKDKSGMHLKVVKAETPHEAYMDVKDPDSPQPYTVNTAYFKLIRPVEELEPYGIADHLHGWIVYKDTPGTVIANFNHTHPNAKKAAQAECARLNAEYRKEMEK